MRLPNPLSDGHGYSYGYRHCNPGCDGNTDTPIAHPNCYGYGNRYRHRNPSGHANPHANPHAEPKCEPKSECRSAAG